MRSICKQVTRYIDHMRRFWIVIAIAIAAAGCASDEQRPSLGDEAGDESSTSVPDTQAPFDDGDPDASTSIVGDGDGTTVVGGGLGTATAG